MASNKLDLSIKEPSCNKCKKMIQTNHARVVEYSRLGIPERIYHGDCAVRVYAEMYLQRDDKIRLDERQRVLDGIKMITEDDIRDLAECGDIVEWKRLLIKKISAMREGED